MCPMPFGGRSRHTPKLNPAIGGLAARYKAKSLAGIKRVAIFQIRFLRFSPLFVACLYPETGTHFRETCLVRTDRARKLESSHAGHE